MTPSRVISTLDKDFAERAAPEAEDDTTGFDPRGHAAKSSAMRRVLGLENGGIINIVHGSRAFSHLSGKEKGYTRRSPPGLGNWDNSCYQNSVLQGLASLGSLSEFLYYSESEETSSTKGALKYLNTRLNDKDNAGKTLWTPPKLKNMSSWQQQDAQEYFSKVLDEVEKDIVKELKRSGTSQSCQSPSRRRNSRIGLTQVASSKEEQEKQPTSHRILRIDNPQIQSRVTSNPLEGMLAQRVGCQTCGYVEGLSLAPFNCLTVPLGREWLYDVRTCLDDFTALEQINGVECVKCTLLHAERRMVTVLESLQSPFENATDTESSQKTIGKCKPIEERLNTVRTALENEDFSEQLLKKCQIGPRQCLTTTKSRQAVIARAPKALVIHINRSIFNERTGLQSKNSARVAFPVRFGLGFWCLGRSSRIGRNEDGIEQWSTNPAESMLSEILDLEEPEFDPFYELRAVVTHQGKHENGHYICYKRSPYKSGIVGAENDDSRTSSSWWRLSDEDVIEVSEENVLAQGGVFMLFYEQIEMSAQSLLHDETVVYSTEDTAEAVMPLARSESSQRRAMMPSKSSQHVQPEELTHAVPNPVNADDIEPDAIRTDKQQPSNDASPFFPFSSPTTAQKGDDEKPESLHPSHASPQLSITANLDDQSLHPEQITLTTQDITASNLSSFSSRSSSPAAVIIMSPSTPPLPPPSQLQLPHASKTYSPGPQDDEARTEAKLLTAPSGISPRTGRDSVSNTGGRKMMKNVAGFVQAN